jgi:hypothetical protein
MICSFEGHTGGVSSVAVGTRKERAYQLPIPHLMVELCRREARRAMIEKLKNRKCRKRLI